jgi:hypothetical protein
LIGVRALLCHAIDDEAKALYLKYGFVESPLALVRRGRGLSLGVTTRAEGETRFGSLAHRLQGKAGPLACHAN